MKSFTNCNTDPYFQQRSKSAIYQRVKSKLGNRSHFVNTKSDYELKIAPKKPAGVNHLSKQKKFVKIYDKCKKQVTSFFEHVAYEERKLQKLKNLIDFDDELSLLKFINIIFGTNQKLNIFGFRKAMENGLSIDLQSEQFNK